MKGILFFLSFYPLLYAIEPWTKMSVELVLKNISVFVELEKVRMKKSCLASFFLDAGLANYICKTRLLITNSASSLSFL